MSLLLLRARIFDENFLFFVFASSQNFGQEDKKTKNSGEEEKEDFCLTGEDDDDD